MSPRFLPISEHIPPTGYVIAAAESDVERGRPEVFPWVFLGRRSCLDHGLDARRGSVAVSQVEVNGEELYLLRAGDILGKFE